MTPELHPCIAAMASYGQWICWRPVPRAGKPGKVDKIPTNPETGGNIDPLNPLAWMSAEQACLASTHRGLGVGFVFTRDDPFFFLDIDGCLSSDGTANEIARELVSKFQGAAVECSHSGKGLHVFGKVSGAFEHSNKNGEVHIELYTSDRFAAIGSAAQHGGWSTGSAETDHTATLLAVASQYFPASKGGDARDVEWTDVPVPEYRSMLANDDKLIEAALKSTSYAGAFGGGLTFADLWHADADALERVYPNVDGNGYDGNSVDLSLASRLAYWTGKNCEHIERLMMRSGLVRAKWTDRPTWLRNTIKKAIATFAGNVLGGGQAPATPPPGVGSVTVTAMAPTQPETRVGMQLYMPPDQVEYFKGCVAIPVYNRVFVPGYGVLGKEGFRQVFNGPNFVMSNGQGAKMTDDAYKAFTGNQVNVTPCAHGITFAPKGEPVVERAGERYVNTWAPVPIARMPGDPSPFFRHLQMMLPDEHDRTILLSYLAAVVQYPGEKFPWCVVLQGVEGNGKSTIARCVELAVGEKYTHQGTAAQLVKDFNAWMYGTIFVVIDDIKIEAKHRHAMERIKPVITQGRLSVEKKGIDASTQSVCCNFLLNTNHQNALPIGANERRFAVLFCRQQTKADLNRDGMTDGYFADYLAWLDSGGYAIMAEFLHTYSIPAELNPSREGRCGRAPETSATGVAKGEAMHEVCQHIEVAAMEEVQGFRGGWLSSVALRTMLEERRIKAAPRELAHRVADLGYVRHPSLARGRLPRSLLEEGRRATVYLQAGHMALNEHDPNRIARMYCAAQNYDTTWFDSIAKTG